MQVPELLDRAKSVTGSDSETARQIGVTPQRINDFRHGRVPMAITVQAKTCEIAGMTEGEQMRYVWEVVRARMGKRTGAALGAVAWIAFTVAGFAQLAASLGSATMYRPTRDKTRECQPTVACGG